MSEAAMMREERNNRLIAAANQIGQGTGKYATQNVGNYQQQLNR